MATDVKERGRVPNRDLYFYRYPIQVRPRGEERLVEVQISGLQYSQWKSLNFGLPDKLEPSDQLPLLTAAILGYHLDSGGPTEVEGPVVAILPLTELFTACREREPAGDGEIQEYLAAKAYWAGRFLFEGVPIGHDDALRLKLELEDIIDYARFHAGELWTYEGSGHMITASAALMKNGPGAPRSSAPIFLVHEQLGDSPRYRAARLLVGKAVDFYTAERPDMENAAKEAIAALESLALVVTGLSSGTLGACIKELKGKGLVPPALAKALEAVWGYGSEEHGVRHGKRLASSVDPKEARFALNLAAAAILYLLDLDAAQP